MPTKYICPKCEAINTDNWPLEINGEIVDGGCQECWEEACDKSWWEMLEAIAARENPQITGDGAGATKEGAA
jgi:hypothetical protein